MTSIEIAAAKIAAMQEDADKLAICLANGWDKRAMNLLNSFDIADGFSTKV